MSNEMARTVGEIHFHNYENLDLIKQIEGNELIKAKIQRHSTEIDRLSKEMKA